MKNLTLDAPATGAFLSNVTSETLLAPVRQEPRKGASAFETLLLHTVSHELRTPFSIIQSSAELLDMMRVDPLVTEQAKTILREIGQVTDLINRLVQFSRWEPGELVAHQEPADIETYDDHRMAMSFSIAGLVASGIRHDTVKRSVATIARDLPHTVMLANRVATRMVS